MSQYSSSDLISWITSLGGFILGIINTILIVYFQYMKRPKIEVLYDPERPEGGRIILDRATPFEGRIEVRNVGNVDAMIYSVHVIEALPQDFSIYEVKEVRGRGFPLELRAGASIIIHYIIDVPSKPWSRSIGFEVETSAGRFVRKFTLSWQ